MIGGGSAGNPLVIKLRNNKRGNPKLGLPPFLNRIVPAAPFVPDSTIIAVTAQSVGPTFPKTVLYQSYTCDAKFQFTPVEVITVDKWFAHLSEPVWQKRGERPQRQQFTAFNPFPIPTPPIVFPDWFQEFSTPVHKKPALQTGAQLFYVGNIFPIESAIFAESVTSSGPFFPRTTLYQSYASRPELSQPKPALLEWFIPFSEPKRFKRSIQTAQQLFYTTDTFPIPKPVLLEWFMPFSEPKRFKLTLKTSAQVFSYFDPNPIPTPPPPTGPIQDIYHRTSGNKLKFWREVAAMRIRRGDPPR